MKAIPLGCSMLLILFAVFDGMALGAPLSAEQAKTQTRRIATLGCQRDTAESECFKWRIRQCRRTSPRRVNCQVVKYLRPGEYHPDGIQVCRNWVYVWRKPRGVYALGGRHYECNDRVPSR